ncbi:hypothetical protein [Deinococcus sp.]|uniref:hypothetical protein n=1 Tax=Deinococcus sp. TaxID=47478 RepID=UPI002869BC8C|nr:hypothetical protein [Deinococcus sp.]
MRTGLCGLLLTLLLAGCAGPRRVAAQVGTDLGTVATEGAAADLQARNRALAQAADVYAHSCAQVLEAMRAETGTFPLSVESRPCSDPALGASALPLPTSVQGSVIHLSGAGYTVNVTDQVGQLHTISAP